ncbi:SprT-like family-domain-containing protein [Morchella snyderi]|nr:SprT-like family-domain-containing protein [Morchella snyderi]
MSDPGIEYSSDELPDLQLLLELEQSLVMKGREITPNQSLPPATLFDPATPPRETTKKSHSKVLKIAMVGALDTSRRLPKEATAATAATVKKQIRKAAAMTAEAGRQKKWDGGHVEAVTSTTPAEDESDYASAVEEVTVAELKPAPRRRLIQKKYLPSSDDDIYEERKELEKLRRSFVDLTGSDSEDAPSQPSRNRSPASQAPQAATVPQTISSGDDLESFTLRYSPPRSTKPRKIIPPATLKVKEAPTPLRKLNSPTKLLPKMPPSQHRKSSDAFWDQEITDSWVDNHTPYKGRAGSPSSRGHDDVDIIAEKGGDDDDDEDDEDDIVEVEDDDYHEESDENRAPSPTKRMPAAQLKPKGNSTESKRAFNARKKQLAEDFFKTIDEKVGKGEISQKTAATGGVKIVWSKTLRTTAGTAKWRAEKLQNISASAAMEHPLSTARVRHHATIELAEKVVDSQEKLYNTMCHEYCHMANYMISNVTKPAHGAEFKLWAAKATREFAHLGVHVTTKHSYEIDAKFKWTCQTPNCGQVYKRHSKSIDISRSRCGACKTGLLLQTHPPLREKRPITGYQAFMKENFGRIKAQNPGVPQKDVMKIVAQAYREAKEVGAVEAVEAVGENGGDLEVMLGELKV